METERERDWENMEEAQKYVWEGAIPLQIHLHESEVTTLPTPPPALVNSYSSTTNFLNLLLFFYLLQKLKKVKIIMYVNGDSDLGSSNWILAFVDSSNKASFQ